MCSIGRSIDRGTKHKGSACLVVWFESLARLDVASHALWNRVHQVYGPSSLARPGAACLSPGFGCRRSGAGGELWCRRIPAGWCCWVRSNAIVERSPRRQAGPLERTGRGVLCRYAWSGNGKAERACATRTVLERQGGGIVAPRRPNAERELVLATTADRNQPGRCPQSSGCVPWLRSKAGHE
jgi:hypothetical protein